MQYEKKDEFGQICRDFDEMRASLQESVQRGSLYDYRAGYEDYQFRGVEDCTWNKTVCSISGICNDVFFFERTGGECYLFLIGG